MSFLKQLLLCTELVISALAGWRGCIQAQCNLNRAPKACGLHGCGVRKQSAACCSTHIAGQVTAAAAGPTAAPGAVVDAVEGEARALACAGIQGDRKVGGEPVGVEAAPRVEHVGYVQVHGPQVRVAVCAVVHQVGQHLLGAGGHASVLEEAEDRKGACAGSLPCQAPLLASSLRPASSVPVTTASPSTTHT